MVQRRVQPARNAAPAAPEVEKRNYMTSWTPEELRRLFTGIIRYGPSWPKVAKEVGTRSEDATAGQGRTFVKKVKTDGWEAAAAELLSKSKATAKEKKKKRRLAQQKLQLKKTKRTPKLRATGINLEAPKKPAGKRTRRPWTKEEHARFLFAFNLWPRQWVPIAKHVGTRNRNQTQDHGYAYLEKLKREGKAIPAAAVSDQPQLLLKKTKKSWEKKPEQQREQQEHSSSSSSGFSGNSADLASAVPAVRNAEQKSGVQCAWSAVEEANFQVGLKLFGRDWKLVAKHVGTRTHEQTKRKGHRYFKQLTREGKAHLIPPQISPGRKKGVKPVRTDAQEQELQRWLRENGLL